MIVVIDWQTFQLQFMQQIVFVKEEDYCWDFWTTSGLYNVTCKVEKMEDDIENIMFVDRFLNEHKNVIKVIDIQPETQTLPIEEVPMDSDEALREEDEERLPELEDMSEEHLDSGNMGEVTKDVV